MSAELAAHSMVHGGIRLIRFQQSTELCGAGRRRHADEFSEGIMRAGGGEILVVFAVAVAVAAALAVMFLPAAFGVAADVTTASRAKRGEGFVVVDGGDGWVGFVRRL